MGELRAFCSYHLVMLLPVSRWTTPLIFWLAPYAGEWAYRDPINFRRP